MFVDLMTAATDDPVTAVLCALAILAAGIAAGYLARRNEERIYRPPTSPPLRTGNSSLVDLEARRVLRQAGERPHARAGRSPLKPSYDGRQHAAAGHGPENTLD